MRRWLKEKLGSKRDPVPCTIRIGGSAALIRSPKWRHCLDIPLRDRPICTLHISSSTSYHASPSLFVLIAASLSSLALFPLTLSPQLQEDAYEALYDYQDWVKPVHQAGEGDEPERALLVALPFDYYRHHPAAYDYYHSIVAVHMFCVDLSRPLSSSTSSDRDSHSSIQTMLSHIQQLQQQNQSNKHERRAHCVLAGTKSDLQPRRVSNEQMGELCEWLNVDRWIDTSAKTGEGVEEAFAEALRLAEKEQRANIMLENEERTGLPTASRFRIKERASTMKEDMMTALEMARHFGDVEFTIHQKQEEQEQDKKEEQEEKEEAEDKHVSNIPANLVILLCRCPSLMKHMKEGEKQAVIKGVSAEVMRSLLQYIYSKTFPPDLSTDEKHIRQVMDAAKRFEIFSLVGLCKQMTNAKAEEDEDEEEEQDNVRKTFVHLVRSEKKERRREEEDLEEHFKMVVNASVYSDVKFLFPPQENNHDKEMKKTKKQHDKEHEEHYNDSQQRTIYAHKVILASRCSYFRSLFLGNFQEKEKDAFEVHDIPYDTFLTLLAFLYTDQLSFSSSSPSLCSSLELMVAADRYGVDRLVEKCCNCFIDGLDEENVVQVIKWSRELSLEQLKAACLQYMLRWMQLHPQSKKELEKKLDDATRQELRQCMPE